ncbi:hypothetical protein [Singulisphaera sp. PoT]|uniref:hypothetical protein n=1 Tax=Singulisphaera sp. PoT TaxID=3411797 RepID=UPI003BF4D58F
MPAFLRFSRIAPILLLLGLSTPVEGNDPDPIWSRTLPGGATIEVVGISFHPSTPKSWWKPDGSPLPGAVCDPSGTKINADDPADALRHRVIVVRVTGLPKGAEYSWSVRESNSGSRGPARRNGVPIPDLHESVSGFPDDLPTCTIGFEVADGPWQTVESSQGNSAHSRADGPSTIFGAAIATKAGTTISVAHNLQELPVRIVAVDDDGVEHEASGSSGGGISTMSLISAEFKLSPDKIREFRLQSRPLKKAEIPNVPLMPMPGP